MTPQPEGRDLAGLEYLDAVTSVLHRRRLAEPEREIWEAAEVQWWWPRDRHEDPSNARVWCDAEGPAAAVIFTRSGGEFSCAVLAEGAFTPAWEYVARRSRELARTAAIDMEIIEREQEMQQAARVAGYVPSSDAYLASWLDPDEIRSPRRPIADGYAVISRDQTRERPHPMIARNGADVEQRLWQCTLYDPHLDLAVRAADDTIAGYSLFWADPVTGVGVVEPMRVDDAHSGRGLGTQLLHEGLCRLAQRGCTRLKVICRASNHVALALYGGAGFRVTDVSRVWRYQPAG
jgi:ribosomal protein S18 acetylase RimI-like enzyme